MVKIIILIVMVIDHIGIFFYPEYEFLRYPGFFATPLFCYLAYQGHKYTSNLDQYLFLLLFFAVLTEPIYILLFVDSLTLNFMFTLLAGILLICLYEYKQNKFSSFVFLLIVPLLLLHIVQIHILYIFVFYFTDNNKILRFVFVSALFLIVFLLSNVSYYYLISLPVLLFFVFTPLPHLNINKYFFYFFYPLHFFIIYGAGVLFKI